MTQLYPKMELAHDLETANHAFISSSVDYCDSLQSDISHKDLKHLQPVQKEAATFLTGIKVEIRFLHPISMITFLPQFIPTFLCVCEAFCRHYHLLQNLGYTTCYSLTALFRSCGRRAHCELKNMQ